MASAGLNGNARNRSAPLARSNITACIRCRQRKKKCDQKLPACSLCEAAGVECVGYDAVAKRQIPRSYVLHLEERVAALEIKLQQHRIAADDDRTSTSSQAADSPALGQVIVGETPTIARQDDIPPPPPPAFPQVPFSKLMGLDGEPFLQAAWHQQAPRDSDAILSSLTDGLGLPANPLPARDKAEFFVKSFFEYSNFSSPLLHEPTFRAKLDGVYAQIADAPPAALDFSVFFVNMVFALGLLTIQKHNPLNVPTFLCDRYYQTALAALNKTPLPHSIEGVQALLLLAQYAYLHPTDFRGWNMIGSALRLAAELGLHRDPAPGTVDCLALDIMRRTFWVAYSMDRNVSIATGRPPCLSDGIITAQYPSLADDEHITERGFAEHADCETSKKQYTRFWFEYRRLQSEMYTVLRENQLPIYQPIDYGQWQVGMAGRLKDWYERICQVRASSRQTSNIAPPEILELTFQRALLYLYRPSPNIPAPAPDTIVALAHCSAYLINLYRRFFRDNKLRLFWQAIENLFNAGTCLIYCYFHSKTVQEKFSAQQLERLIYSTSTVLWGMVERFPAFKEKRDAFDTMSSQALVSLGQRANDTQDSETHETPTAPSHNYHDRDLDNGGAQILGQSGLAHLLVDPELRQLPPPGDNALSHQGTFLHGQGFLLADTHMAPAVNLEDVSLDSGTEHMALDWEAFNGDYQSIPFVWDVEV